MAVLTRRIWVIGSITVLLVLSALVGICHVWAGLGLKRRPWHLEAHLESSMAASRANPNAYVFGREVTHLAAQADEAGRCLVETDRKWLPARNYAGCISRLLSACLEARLLELKLAERQQEEKEKLGVMLASLHQELDIKNESKRIWSRFDLRNINKNRAMSLAQQSEKLASEGQFESALNNVLLALTELQKYKDQNDSAFARFEDEHLRRKWDREASELLQWTKESGRRAILVDKLEHLCMVLNRGKLEKSYPANLGRQWYRQKSQEHDSSTPEGKYSVRRMNPSGKYGFALLLDYPSTADREKFKALKQSGAISSGSRIGGNVEIHGGGRESSDWTDGCISLHNDDMRDLYRRSYPGMPVTIVGTCRFGSSSKDP